MELALLLFGWTLWRRLRAGSRAGSSAAFPQTVSAGDLPPVERDGSKWNAALLASIMSFRHLAAVSDSISLAQSRIGQPMMEAF